MYSYFSTNNLPSKLDVSTFNADQFRTFARNYSKHHLSKKSLAVSIDYTEGYIGKDNSMVVIIYEKKSHILITRDRITVYMSLDKLIEYIEQRISETVQKQAVAKKLAKLGFIGAKTKPDSKKYIGLNAKRLDMNILLDCESELEFSEEEIYNRIVTLLNSKVSHISRVLFKSSEYICFNNKDYLVIQVALFSIIINCNNNKILDSNSNEYSSILANYNMFKGVI